MSGGRSARLIGLAIYGVANALCVAVFLFPLWRPVASATAYGLDDPAALGLLVLCGSAALVFEAGAAGLGPRAVAVLGVLVAINSVLRFIEVALPGPGGFTPIFALIILTGRAYGPRFGFLMGALTLVVSAVITGGVGPWLPYQMLTAAWVGLTAGWLPRRPAPGARWAPRRAEVWGLAAFGAAWGLGYGLLMTLWFWPFIDAAGAGAAGTVTAAAGRFAVFYAASSLGWDLFGAAGNAALVALAGAPVLAALRRMEPRIFDADRRLARGVGDGMASRQPARDIDSVGAEDACGQPGTSTGQGDAGDARAIDLGEPAPTRPQPTPSNLLPASLHPRAWVAWLAAVAALASTTRHPLVLLGLGLAVALVRARLPATGRLPALPVARLASVLIPFATVYNALLAHAGTTVVLRLPAGWPLIGGPLTLEAAAYGALTGAALALLMLAFATFQTALSARDIVRLIPRAFGALALVAAVALTYAPSMRGQIAAVREAQAVRGLRARGWRAWLPLAMPVLVGGLERALDLADSMIARGLLPPPGPPPARARLAILAALGLVAGGWLGLHVAGVAAGAARLAVAAGIALAAATLVGLGRRAPRTDFRPRPWGGGDTLVAATAWAPLAVKLLVPAARLDLAWSPYPTLALPPLDPWLALALLGAAGPAWALGRGGIGRHVDAGERPETVEQDSMAKRGGVGATDAAGMWVDVDAPGGGGMPGGAGATDAGGTPGGVDAPGDGRERVGIDAPRAVDQRGAAIRFRGFAFTYPGAGAPAVAGLDADLPAGGLTLVAGPSGAGKSTLLRALNGLVPHATGGTVSGGVRVGSRDPVALGPAGMSPHVGWVGGDPERAFVADGVADEVAFALEHHGVAPVEIQARVAAALARTGLAGLADRPLDSLSGGERQRVAIAAVLALAPDVMVLDEPTSQLDDASAAAVLDCVADLVAAGGRTAVVSEHRLDRVAARAARAVYLPGGGRPAVIGDPGPVLAGISRIRVPAPPAVVDAVGHGLALIDVAFAYGGGPPVVDGLTLAVRPGEVVALTGRSGAGKSTVLRLAVGLLAPRRGDVRVAGASIRGRPVAEVCRAVGYLPQDPDLLLFAPTVRAELRATLANHGLVAGGDSRPDGRIDDLLAVLGLSGVADRYPRDLSTGQRQRVALGAVLVTRPRVVLLDEPTRGLDAGAIAALAGLLHGLAGGGAAVLVATHDRRLLPAAHREVGLDGGW